MSLADKALTIAQAHHARYQVVIERAKTDPIASALYQCFLIACDISHDASLATMDDALTEIQDIAKAALGLRS